MNLLLTGRPGVGKTTVVTATVARLRDRGVEVSGFYTEEVRDEGRRVGFDIVILGDAADAVPLARIGLSSDVTVARYGVDVAAVADHVLPTLHEPTGEVVAVDEIAPMELACPGFAEAVERLLDDDRHVLATVHARAGGFADRVKARDDVEVLTVTTDNRDDLPDSLADRLAPKRS